LERLTAAAECAAAGEFVPGGGCVVEIEVPLRERDIGAQSVVGADAAAEGDVAGVGFFNFDENIAIAGVVRVFRLNGDLGSGLAGEELRGARVSALPAILTSPVRQRRPSFTMRSTSTSGVF
jgi:hypothetical protein